MADLKKNIKFYQGVKGTCEISHGIDAVDYYDLGNSANYNTALEVVSEDCIRECFPELKNKKITVKAFSYRTLRVDECYVTIEFTADYYVEE